MKALHLLYAEALLNVVTRVAIPVEVGPHFEIPWIAVLHIFHGKHEGYDAFVGEESGLQEEATEAHLLHACIGIRQPLAMIIALPSKRLGEFDKLLGDFLGNCIILPSEEFVKKWLEMIRHHFPAVVPLVGDIARMLCLVPPVLL